MISLPNCLERYIKRLAGKSAIENAVGELESVIQGEHYTATAQVLQDTSQLRRGAWPYRPGPHSSLNFHCLDAEQIAKEKVKEERAWSLTAIVTCED